MVEAVSALADITEDPAKPPEVLTDAAQDPASLLMVAVVASGLGTDHAPAEVVAQQWPVTEAGAWQASTSNEYAESLNKLRDSVRQRLSENAADLLTGPWWDTATARWQTHDFGGIAMAADQVRKWDHDLLRQLLANAGLPDPVDAAIVFVVPLPGDHLMNELAKVIKVVGIAFAFATGHAVWACASVKSLLHDELVGVAARVIRNEVVSVFSAVTPTKPGPAASPLEEAIIALLPGRSRSLSLRPPEVAVRQLLNPEVREPGGG